MSNELQREIIVGAWYEGYLDGLRDGYDEGQLDERKRQALRKWDTVPDVDGWYWFDGEYSRMVYAEVWHMEPPEDIWKKHRGMVLVEGEFMYAESGEYECDESRIIGTLYGPLTPPWEGGDG